MLNLVLCYLSTFGLPCGITSCQSWSRPIPYTYTVNHLHFPQNAAPLLPLSLANLDSSLESPSLSPFCLANSFKCKDVQLVCHKSLTGTLPGLAGYTEDHASAGADICQIHHGATKSECHFLHIKQ